MSNFLQSCRVPPMRLINQTGSVPNTSKRHRKHQHGVVKAHGEAGQAHRSCMIMHRQWKLPIKMEAFVVLIKLRLNSGVLQVHFTRPKSREATLVTVLAISRRAN